MQKDMNDCWSTNLRGFTCFDDSDDDDIPTGLSADTQLLKDLDLSSRLDEVDYKPNPWSIAKINAAFRPSQSQSHGLIPSSTFEGATLKSGTSIDTNHSASVPTSHNAERTDPDFKTTAITPELPPRPSPDAIVCEKRFYPRLPKPPMRDKTQATILDSLKKQASRTCASDERALKPGEVMGQKLTATALPVAKGQGARTMLGSRFLVAAPRNQKEGEKAKAETKPVRYGLFGVNGCLR
jgi:hypothetical protein